MIEGQGKRLSGAAMLFGAFVFPVICTEGVSARPHQKGQFTAVFNEFSPLSDIHSMTERLRITMPPSGYGDHHYVIGRESFEVYVPECYEPNTPFGLLVWISPGPVGTTDNMPGSKELMDKHKLIWVGANHSGNPENVYLRRIPLALDAAYNMQKLYTIDENRVYVAGLSGGGRSASMTAFHHSDVYAGGIFIIGANYWLSMDVPGKKNTRWQSGGSWPHRENLLRAKEFGRYVFLTGDYDGNRLQMHTYYERAYSKMLDHALYIQVPGMGHQAPPPEEFEKAIVFLDQPLSEEESMESEREELKGGD